MPPIWILAIFAISCTTTILEICHASEAEFDMNRLGKLGIENPFFPESCKSTCPENSPESFGKVSKDKKMSIYLVDPFTY